jgi:adenylate kinase
MDIQTFLMMGRPGSGKGTQGKLLADAMGAKLYSSGERFRDLATKDTYLGKKVKMHIERGDLLPHWLASFLYEETLFALEPSEIIVFEGACRKEAEAVRFHEVARWLNRPYKAIFVDVPEEVLRARLLERSKTEGRADDSADVITNRFVQYNADTAHAIEYFASQGELITINGNRPIEEVHQDIMRALGK